MKEENIKVLYDMCKDAYELDIKIAENPQDEELKKKRIPAAELDKIIGEKIGVKSVRSIRTYRTNYNNLVNNEEFATHMGTDIYLYYLKMFKQQLSDDEFKKILVNTQHYLKERYRMCANSNNALRAKCQEYSDELILNLDFSRELFAGITPVKKAAEIKQMFILADLKELRLSIKEKINTEYTPSDVLLTDNFKALYGKYKRENGENVEFFSATAIITTSKNNRIYLPNQWFILAAYISPFIKEIIRYRACMDLITDDDYPTISDKQTFYDEIREYESEDEISSLGERIKETLNDYNVFSDIETAEIADKLCKFSTNRYVWWNIEEESNSKKGKSMGRSSDYYVPAALNLLGVVQASQSGIAAIANDLASEENLYQAVLNCLHNEDASIKIEEIINDDVERIKGGQNIIVYGAPGTGKSRDLEDKYSGNNNILKKIVFHPEYTYFDFVGSYKPVPVYKKTSDEFTTVGGEAFDKGEPFVDYRFVPGPFVETLILAWNNPSKMVTLLIDEINRANTAAVFGEVFQLLDRKASGESEYKINTSYDLRGYIKGIGLGDFISAGLGIPSNMNIVATMNSADQGVFNMDSAFKRRWNFEYKKIDITKANHRSTNIMYAGELVPWGVFAYAVNEKMKADQMDEDRLIGPFYIKPDELENKKALDKLLLYLWDDVYRHRRKTSDVFLSSVKVFSELTEKFASEDVLLLKNVIDKLYEEDILTTLNIIETSEDETIEDIQDDEKNMEELVEDDSE